MAIVNDLEVRGNSYIHGNVQIEGDLYYDNLKSTSLFPLGTVYVTTDSEAEPSTLFQGSWTSLGTDTLAGTTVYVWKRDY